MEKIEQNEGIKTVRITCFQYAKEIPIKSTYNEFKKEFKKAFDIKDSIHPLSFNLHFLTFTNEGKARSFQYTLDSDESYKNGFVGKDSLSKQCNQVTGLAIFPNSEEARNRKIESDPVQMYKSNPKPFLSHDVNNLRDNKKKNLLLCCETINDEQKKELIELLKKDINDLKMKISFEEQKNANLLRRKKEKIQNDYKGLDDENEVNHNNYNYKEKYNNYNKPLAKIPEELTIRVDQEHESILIKSNFLHKKSDKIIKSLKNIQNNESIEYTFKIIKEDNITWPKDMILFCIPDDNDIYFKHVKIFNNGNVKHSIKNNKEYFEIPVTIIFKQNAKYIKKGNYKLKAKLISDSKDVINLDAGKLNLQIVD